MIIEIILGLFLISELALIIWILVDIGFKLGGDKDD